MDKKFYKVDNTMFITNVNIDHIVEWRIKYDGELRISMVDHCEYDIPPWADGYPVLLKSLQERTA